MGYTQTVVREFETGEWTIRELVTGEFVLAVCFPHDTMDDYGNVKQGWRKSHFVHASYGPGNTPKRFKAFGLAWEYAQRHYPNAVPQPKLSKPLARGDKVTAELLADVPVH